MTTTTKPRWIECGNCGNHAWSDDDYGDCCKYLQGDRVDARVSDGDWINTNTQVITGTLMLPFRPGDDLLLDVTGRRVYYPASRVFDVMTAAPSTGGF